MRIKADATRAIPSDRSGGPVAFEIKHIRMKRAYQATGLIDRNKLEMRVGREWRFN